MTAGCARPDRAAPRHCPAAPPASSHRCARAPVHSLPGGIRTALRARAHRRSHARCNRPRRCPRARRRRRAPRRRRARARPPDAVAADLAARQHGVLSMRQAREAGPGRGRSGTESKAAVVAGRPRCVPDGRRPADLAVGGGVRRPPGGAGDPARRQPRTRRRCTSWIPVASPGPRGSRCPSTAADGRPPVRPPSTTPATSEGMSRPWTGAHRSRGGRTLPVDPGA